LRRLFVHAYQSYLFNRILSRRLAAGLPLERAVEGDMVCFTRGQMADTGRLQAVTQENLAAVNRLAERGRAFVTLPLIGYETTLAQGLQGEIERELLGEQGVEQESFRAIGDLGSRGARRTALLRISPQIKIEEKSAELEFFLPKGSYATVLLREYTKSVTVITE